jgi:hypothetical protein
MADDNAPPAPESHEAPYLMQMPDGSVQSRVLTTDRPVTHGELSGYVASQGGVYMGPPSPPTPPPAAPPPAPAPEWQPPPPLPPNATDADRAGRAWALGMGPPEPPPPVAAPVAVPAPGVPYATVPEQAWMRQPPPAVEGPPPDAPEPTARDVYFPQRSFRSQVPSILGSSVFGATGTALATPLGPEVAIPVGMAAAGAGSVVGEGSQILAEKISGSPPAEPGGAWSRLGNAFTRGATFEGLTAPLRYVPILAASKALPIGEATKELEPVLTGTGGSTALADWWGQMSTRAPGEIVKEWGKLGTQGQARIAGEHLPAMQTIVDTLAKGEAPIGKVGYGSYGASATGVPTAILQGHPYAAAAAALPAVREVVREGVPTVASSMLRSPQGAWWLARLPAVSQTAGPIFTVPLRAASQVVGARAWPSAEVAFPPSAGAP